MSERALLFTDVVDSTRLVERLGDARAAEVWTAHDRFAILAGARGVAMRQATLRAAIDRSFARRHSQAARARP